MNKFEALSYPDLPFPPASLPRLYFYGQGHGPIDSRSHRTHGKYIGHHVEQSNGLSPLHYFRKGGLAERVWLARKIHETGESELPTGELQQLIDLFYEQIEPVDEFTRTRFKDLDLFPPRPLTTESISLLTENEFLKVFEDDSYEHPALLAAREEALSLYGKPHESALLGLYRPRLQQIFWNVEDWLRYLKEESDDGIDQIIKSTREHLLHENIHFQCTPNLIAGELKRFLATLLLIDEIQLYDLILDRHDKKNTKAIRAYQDLLTQFLRAENYDVQVRGGQVHLLYENLKITRVRTFIDEGIAHYEAAQIDTENIEFREELLLNPIDSFPQETRQVVRFFQETLSPFKEMEQRVGNQALLRAYFKGEIYNLIYSLMDNQELGAKLSDLIVSDFPCWMLETPNN